MLGKDLDALCMDIPPLFTLVLNIAKNMTVIRYEAEVLNVLLFIRVFNPLNTKCNCIVALF